MNEEKLTGSGLYDKNWRFYERRDEDFLKRTKRTEGTEGTNIHGLG
jgi:hypothetical protein